MQADPKTLLIIGGNIGRGGAPIGNPPPHLVFGNTWTIDLSNNGYKAERGPSLMTARFSHSCGKMELAGIVLIVVAGGHDKELKCLNSVELLELSSTKGWGRGMYYQGYYLFIALYCFSFFEISFSTLYGFILGPNLPFNLCNSSMVTSPSGKGVILIGLLLI